jgi:hypothetical protein
LEVGLPENASDAAIVTKAWDLERTIVTGNGRDFINLVLRFQKQTKKKDCHELYGLIILPNRYEAQKRLMGVAEKKLRHGDKKITWADVWRKNYCVRVRKSGVPQITAFPKCLYCKKLE